MDMKKLPIGIDDFEKLRKEDFYYVDKTGLISELISSWSEVNLFTRPRRFGKSLNMSMLKCFFEIGTDKSIFDGLKISEDKALCERYMGRYPVVSISLKGVDGLKFEDAYSRLRVIIRNEAQRLSIVRDSTVITDEERSAYLRIIEEKDTRTDIESSLQTFCALLEKHYGQKTILLIDEYDVPLDKAYAHGYYPQMIDLIRSMFGAALKTNSSLHFAVLTGCLRVSKESIFTGLNNLRVHSISDMRFDEHFGFTDDEVKRMLADYGVEERYGDAREWYDGYRFGEQYVYCPWDMINYCYDLRSDPEAEPKAYWINTSGNDMVRGLIDRSSNSATARREIERLIAGETISKQVNEQLTHSEIDSDINNLWSLLYMTGYLTITQKPSGGIYALCIPNREICEIYKKQVLAWFNDKVSAETDRLSELYRAFEDCDTSAIERLMYEQLRYTVSFHDAYESFYHGFLLALLGNCGSWVVRSNRESGNGRSDITVERDDGELGFVIEVKVAKAETALDAACEEALQQIEDRSYADALRGEGIREVIAYGIAFCDKRCRVQAKKLLPESER